MSPDVAECPPEAKSSLRPLL
ncbi:hypothetical protein VULLAG_LOCUS9218 [Vulpes lagopus]